MKKNLRKRLILLILAFVAAVLLSPQTRFNHPYSKILYDRDGGLLGGKIATDGQWRFPEIDSVPENYVMALLEFEDRRFHRHIGLDFKALIRAIKQNYKANKIVSGASTLTMQVCRMSRGDKPRTIPQKLIEIAMALKLELSLTKEEILALHASHAPYGGNVVGLEAASWRYFSKSPAALGIAEAALLAVLPNAPSLMHPGKNRTALQAKRDRLLKRLMDNKKITQENYELALLEPIPAKPTPLPRLTPHLLEYAYSNENNTSKLVTTIDRKIQTATNRTAEIFSAEYQQSDIHNVGILVLDTWTGETLAYVGNSPNTQTESAVDMVQAHRSSGSVLKPFLHAYALDEGLISPEGLVMDVPVHYNGYSPQNYNKNFLGAVKADEALAMSLNIPATNLLQEYDVNRFIQKLQQQGFTTINRSADDYGLTLVLGGAEISLWDLTSAYASLGRIHQRYKKEQSQYSTSDLQTARITPQEKKQTVYGYEPDLVSAAAIHHTLVAMQKVSRPDEEGDWQSFESAHNISWKTGTSFGHRDAWAVGVSPRYTVGVWVGNADGEGKHSLIGVKKAAPILFDVFNRLDDLGTFGTPYDDLIQNVVCRETGYTAGKNCEHRDTLYQIATAAELSCPFHFKVNLDREGNRVHSHCESISNSERKSFMILPADAAHFYRQKHPEYQALPPYRADCENPEEKVMQFIYPKRKAKIFLPKDGDGEKESAIFQVVHRKPESKLYWHLDDSYLGMTEGEHQMQIAGSAGKHELVLVDEQGNSIGREFEIVGLD